MDSCAIKASCDVSLAKQDPYHDIWQQMADFIANTEFTNQLTPLSNTHFQYQLTLKEQQIDKKLQEITSEIQFFRTIMSRSGASQWHNETEKLLSQSKCELKLIEDTFLLMKSAITEQCDQLNRASMNTMKTLFYAVNTAQKSDLQKITEQNTAELQFASAQSLQRASHIVQRLHWKNLCMVALLTLIVSLITSLYIDGHWPWETHQHIVKEREAGQALMKSWSQLNHSDQLTIAERI